MSFFKSFIFLLLITIPGFSIEAQENQNNKPPTAQSHSHLKAPTAGLNLGAVKLKENLGYKIDPNTHIGIGSGFKFGLKINF